MNSYQKTKYAQVIEIETKNTYDVKSADELKNSCFLPYNVDMYAQRDYNITRELT